MEYKYVYNNDNRLSNVIDVLGNTSSYAYAYFNRKTWKWKNSKKSNPRYKKAVKACAKYLKYFGNNKVKSYKLKY